ncbi:MAG TPA: APC family permease, partial [Terriglobales bacterium]|nr:APC family permease [Terriglobales bacterium]
RILGTFSPLAFLPQAAIREPLTVTWGQLVAIGAIVLISLINYIGVKRAGEFQLFFTMLKVAIILGIVAAGFTYSRGTWSNFATTYPQAVGGFAGFMTALIAALWAYDGWNLVTTVSAEMRDPQRSLPIALIFGVAAVAVLYMLVNGAVQFVMPAEAIASSPRPASEAMARVAGSLGAGVVSAGMALSMLVTLNGSALTGARIPFALARDGYFFPAIARIHPRFHTPSTAIVVQAALASLLVLFAGNFQQLFSLTLFAEWLFYMLAAASVFLFRVREPNANRPYRTWGYPVVPALFIVASAVLLYYSFMANWRNSLVGVMVILAGIPVFYRFSSKRASQSS